MFDISELNKTNGLQPVFSRVAWQSPPPVPSRLTFLYDQQDLPAGIAFVATSADAETFFAGRHVTAAGGAMLFIAGWKGADIAFPDGLTVFAFSEPIGVLFNSLETYLRKPQEELRFRQFNSYWSEIVSNDNLTNDDIRAMLNRLPGAEAPFAQVCSVAFDNTSPGPIPYVYVMRQLLALLPHSFGTIRNNEIVILITYHERRFDYPYNNEQLIRVLEKYGGHMGIGNGTRDLSALPLLYTLISHTVRLAMQIQVGQESRIHTLERLGMYLIIDMAARGFRAFTNSDGLMYLSHPAITYLTRYDEENDNNLRFTLYFYLLSDKSIAATAQRLHMHRNTVMYKLKKISELCNLDLDDPYLCERLLFSCQLARYYEEINRSKKILTPDSK